MAIKGSNYSILVDVDLDTSKIQSQLNQAAKKVKIGVDTGNATQQIDQVADAGENMGLSFQAANAILRTTIDIVSSMTEQVYELDGAITEFKKVSDLSGTSLDNYVAKLADMGTQVARTGSEMVEAATEFKKSGFGDEEAANLALVATQLQNIADDAISAGDASNFIISQLKAFNLEAEDATYVIDALNEV